MSVEIRSRPICDSLRKLRDPKRSPVGNALISRKHCEGPPHSPVHGVCVGFLPSTQSIGRSEQARWSHPDRADLRNGSRIYPPVGGGDASQVVSRIGVPVVPRKCFPHCPRASQGHSGAHREAGGVSCAITPALFPIEAFSRRPKGSLLRIDNTPLSAVRRSRCPQTLPDLAGAFVRIRSKTFLRRRTTKASAIDAAEMGGVVEAKIKCKPEARDVAQSGG